MVSFISPVQLSLPPNPTKSKQSNHSHISETLRTDILYNFSTPFELKQIHAQIIKTESSLSILPLSRVGLVCALSPAALITLDKFSDKQKSPRVMFGILVLKISQKVIHQTMRFCSFISCAIVIYIRTLSLVLLFSKLVLVYLNFLRGGLSTVLL